MAIGSHRFKGSPLFQRQIRFFNPIAASIDPPMISEP
jgi:hypothetical protein